MVTNEHISSAARLERLATLLDAHNVDGNVAPCVTGRINTTSHIVVGSSFDRLRTSGTVDQLFELFESLFGDDNGRYYICTSPECSKVYAKGDESLRTLAIPLCFCGRPLRRYYDARTLISYYERQTDYEYNYIRDDSGKILAFSSGRVVCDRHITDALLGPFYPAYREELAQLTESTKAIYRYFDDNDDSLLGPIYLADNGGVLKQARNDPTYVFSVIVPLLYSAYINAGKRLVCINYHGSTMFALNELFGFETIYRVGNLVYLGLKDVTLPLLSCQQLQMQLYKLLARKHIP